MRDGIQVGADRAPWTVGRVLQETCRGWGAPGGGAPRSTAWRRELPGRADVGPGTSPPSSQVILFLLPKQHFSRIEKKERKQTCTRRTESLPPPGVRQSRPRLQSWPLRQAGVHGHTEREGHSGPKEQPPQRWGAVEVSSVRLLKPGRASFGETDPRQLWLQQQRERGQDPKSPMRWDAGRGWEGGGPGSGGRIARCPHGCVPSSSQSLAL